MRLLITALVLAGALTACGQATTTIAPSEQQMPADGRVAQGGMTAERGVDAPAPAPVSADAEVATDATRGGAPPQQPNMISPSAQTMFLAYSYQMGLEIPSARLASVMDAHVRACQTAGPRICQLVGANRSGDPESSMNGTLNVRGEPNWLRTFMGGIAAQVNAAGGRVLSQATTTEDLTRQIVDTQAHLRAQTALRDRLQQLLQNRPGRLSDLLEVERELARVQGDIDATQSNLAVMRTRVDMSELTLSYQSAPRSVGSDTFEPLRQSFANFLGIVVGGFAAIIVLIAGLLPFAVVLVPIVWGLLAWRRRRGRRLFGSKPPPETPET
jgi:ABC-type multidrug transport system fused ATPase/permease subunit